ncbi:MAG: RcpC/CpaB family pilus assembly protein, partial [Acidimicrobiales bacterium]
GELIQTSDVIAGGSVPGGREVSFSIESARAVDGKLQRGEMVDVLVTYGTGNEAYTVAVARGVRVINRRQPGGTLGDGRDEVVTVSVTTGAQTLALAHAVSAGAVTLVRTAEGAGPGEAGVTSYQAPGPGPGPGG